MDIIIDYIIIDYLNSLLKAAISLRVTSGWQQQAAANFDVSPFFPQYHMSNLRNVTIIFSPCHMSLSPMLRVEFKKCPCCPFDFRGQGPSPWQG